VVLSLQNSNQMYVVSVKLSASIFQELTLVSRGNGKQLELSLAPNLQALISEKVNGMNMTRRLGMKLASRRSNGKSGGLDEHSIGDTLGIEAGPESSLT
jgi:hypothetical protein